MAPLRAIAREHSLSSAAGHGVLWLLGDLGIVAGGWLLGRRIKERDIAQRALERHQHQLEDLVEERTSEVTQANEKLLREIDDRNRLEKEILNISEREQRRIGQELHDSLGQQLTGVAIMSKVLEQQLDRDSSDRAAGAAKITSLINRAIDQTRGLSKGLHPVDVDAGGFVPAMHELAVSTERLFGISCSFGCSEDIDVNRAAVATHLYRITQEAITNAIKHGQAQNVNISLTCDGQDYTLEIAADGKDFPDELPDVKGMGLRIMVYRANLIGGALDVSKGASGGSVVSCTFGEELE
jgi:two-component system CheB/CheR fusion protein